MLISDDFAPAYFAVSRYGELRLCSISYMVCTFFSSQSLSCEEDMASNSSGVYVCVYQRFVAK